MTSTKARMVVLAKSWKRGGFCVAGKLLDGSDRWVRPVCDVRGGGLSALQLRLADGGEVEVLSVVDAVLGQAMPNGVQRENCLLGDGAWRYVGAWDRRRLDELTDAVDRLWLGPERHLAPAQAVRCDRSLALVRVDSLIVEAGPHPYRSGYQFLGSFDYRGVGYRQWSVTAPNLCRRLESELDRSEPFGRWELGPAFLCLSLSQPFNGYHYKLIAEVFEA